MTQSRFGVEIEMTGVSRREAADIINKVIRGTVKHVGGGYDTYTVTAQDGREWKVVRD